MGGVSHMAASAPRYVREPRPGELLVERAQLRERLELEREGFIRREIRRRLANIERRLGVYREMQRRAREWAI
jgi:hypothetical protein